ncbi:MAG: methyltransferase type 11, partial [Promethearchaeia archaeon]
MCLGGTRPASGWTIVNALPLPGVDVVAEISNLRAWCDGSVDMVYMSHTLEHLDYMDLLQPTLQEVAR